MQNVLGTLRICQPTTQLPCNNGSTSGVTEQAGLLHIMKQCLHYAYIYIAQMLQIINIKVMSATTFSTCVPSLTLSVNPLTLHTTTSYTHLPVTTKNILYALHYVQQNPTLY